MSTPARGIARRALPALALAGCVAPPGGRLVDIQPAAGPFTIPCHVVARDWHTDIALPVAGLRPELASLARDFPGVRHLVFGFGDRGWLLGQDTSPLAMLRAVLPGRGAILLTALAAAPEVAFGADEVVPLPLAPVEFDRLQGFIAGSFDRGGIAPGDHLPPIADGPYPGSVFHASTITYAATYTCNTWTAEALVTAGLPSLPAGIVFAHQVMSRARRIAASRLGGA